MSDRPPQRPAFCPFIYTDGVDLFLEFNQSVLRFTFTEGGLHKALAHIPNVTRQPGFVRPNSGNIADRVLTKPVKVARKTQQAREAKERASKLSDHARATVKNIVRRMG